MIRTWEFVKIGLVGVGILTVVYVAMVAVSVIVEWLIGGCKP
jgi:hypothetical protein